MAEAVLMVLLLFPSMLGIAELIHLAKVYIISPKVKPEKTVVVYLKGEQAVGQLQYILQEYAWQGERYAKKIIAVDCGIAEDLAEECERIANKNNITFQSDKGRFRFD